MTLSAGIDMEISCPTATLSQSSMIFSTRNVLPLCSLSLTKSIDHVVFGSDGITIGFLTRAGSLFFQLAALLVMHLFIYSIHLLVVPGLAVMTKSLEDLPEAVTELRRFADSLLHFTVILLFSVIEI